MTHLLDTHVWIWFAENSPELSDRAYRLLNRPDVRFGVCDISLWEVATKLSLGKLELTRPLDSWLEAAAGLPSIRVIPISPPIASESARLPGSFHKDPADRLIVATARVLGLTLVTRDARIQEYPHVQTLW